ncbi:hypothetical protein NC653_034040 [Populus alba x Populus x berolinensis]|nr:hypothetical protein NC653_034040 [Populus alba x Populus x berolinensis]
MSRIPVWVRFPNLPLCCGSPSCLSKIASVLGKPIQSDHMTSTLSHMSYAHVLVEIDLREDLQHSVAVSLPSGPLLHQKVVYEAMPKLCNYCNVLGHTRLLCPKVAASATEDTVVNASNMQTGKGSVFGHMGPQTLPTHTRVQQQTTSPVALVPSVEPTKTVAKDNELASCDASVGWTTVEPRQKANKHIRNTPKGKEIIITDIETVVNPRTEITPPICAHAVDPPSVGVLASADVASLNADNRRASPPCVSSPVGNG